MTQVIQVEIRTGCTHTVTWLDAALKPKPGMALLCKGDLRHGPSCTHTASLRTQRGTAMQVGGLRTAKHICAA